jgi:hypothetical protein
MHGFGNGSRNTALALGAVCFFLLFAAQAKALARPALAAPANGATVAALPAFTWAPVSGAAKYQIQIASDSNFASLAEGGDFFTRNTRATLKRAMPDGRFWWRVRASNSSGTASRWSAARSIVKNWGKKPTPLYPADGTTLTYPEDAFRLTWSSVPRTYKYSVTVSEDAALATPLEGFPLLTSATSITRQSPDLQAGGTYYWRVTPQDSRGNTGSPSVVSSFHWDWPSTLSLSLQDLVDDDEVFDPRFSWPLLPGAAEYRVEVNSDDEFDTGSKVLDVTTVGSSLTTRQLLPNNTYYWRVRAVDQHGHEGVWNEGTPFQKSFADETVMGRTSVTDLRMLYADEDPGTAGYQTTTPVVVWDPVPGASGYDVEVGSWTGATCDYTNPLEVVTATSAWTPLASAPAGNGEGPYSTSDFPTPAHDSLMARSAGNAYCLRVRPRDRSHSSTGDGDRLVVGTFTELNGSSFSFDWTAYPVGGACSPSCNPGYIGANDYLAPVKGSTVGAMPLFRWNAVTSAQSYFVVVARDAGFTTVVDYAFTRIPAYAPRRGHGNTQSRTYSDETTKFYWVVLPSPNLNGAAAASNPLQGAASEFLKQTTPPTLLAPANGAQVATWPTFRWTPVHGARTYEIQVDDSNTFASPVDTKRTNSTAYTSETTYEADKVLYWRVRPLDDTNTALTWSETRTLQRKLPKPVWDSGLPTAGATTPTFTWAPITGAISYDISADLPDGTHKQFNDLSAAALTWVFFYGVGPFDQQVRANFPSMTGTPTHGPWSTTHRFTRTIPAPANPIASVSKSGLSFSWQPRAEAREYRLQVSKTSDFERPVETVTTDNTVYAPTLSTSGYLAGGSFFWRVAAVDEGRNVGQYSPAKRITLRKGMRLSALGAPERRQWETIKFTARHYSGTEVVRGAAVKIWGAGVRKATKRTKADGSVTFRVRATRMGTVYALATKRGFQPVRIELRVR